MGTKIWLVVFVNLILGALGAVFIYRSGPRFHLIDRPNQRSSHTVPTPTGGGCGLWIAFIFTGFFILRNPGLAIIAASIGMFGLCIDWFDFSPSMRLLFESIASLVCVVWWSVLPLSLSTVCVFLFWILFLVGTANIYNFMDGINGMAALTGIAGFGLLALFALSGSVNNPVGLASLAIALSGVGFLPFNFPRARVFMGDTGSLFLGFVFACFVLKLSFGFREFICLGMFLCMFYADEAMTIFYRLRKGENLLRPHRRHLYQYLCNELTFPHWQVSLGYAFIQLMVGLLSWLAYKAGIIYQFLVWIGFGIIFAVTYRLVKAVRPVRSP